MWGRWEQRQKENKRLVRDVTAQTGPDSNQYFGKSCTISHQTNLLEDDLQYKSFEMNCSFIVVFSREI